MREIELNELKNPQYVLVGNKKMKFSELVDSYIELKKQNKKAIKKYLQEQALKPYQAELIKMQDFLEKNQKRMVVLFEGRDAAGKGGTIRRVTRYMNEKHYRVVALGKPSDVQKTQWYFQRYTEQLPRGGEIVLFDRSWYNRAMVEPVFGFCTEEEYENFKKDVVDYEKSLVRNGTILVKIYLSISKEEQAKRFAKRQRDPLRQWKLSEIDLQAQDKWDDFTQMKYEMLKTTHTIYAPWTVIRSDDKFKARLNTMKVILNAVDYNNRDEELDFVPDKEIVVSGAREIEIMEVDRINSGKFTS
jgi:polyphosphate kinase 2